MANSKDGQDYTDTYFDTCHMKWHKNKKTVMENNKCINRSIQNQDIQCTDLKLAYCNF